MSELSLGSSSVCHCHRGIAGGGSLKSNTLSQTALRDLALYQLAPLLSTVNGVAKIDVQGGTKEEIHVTTDPARLAAYGLTTADLSKALNNTNVLTAVGRLEDHQKLYSLLADARLADLALVRDTVLRVSENGVVRVGDVADVAPGQAPIYHRVTADGRDGVLLSVRQQPGGNTVQIDRALKATFDTYQPKLPRGVMVAKLVRSEPAHRGERGHPGREKPDAPDPDDDDSYRAGAAAARAGHRPGVRHATAAGHRDHLRAGGASANGTDRPARAAAPP